MDSSVTSERKGNIRPWKDKKRNLKDYGRRKQVAAQASRMAEMEKFKFK